MANRVVVNVLLTLILLQTIAPVIAATPASIVIDSPASSVTADGALRFSAIVKDSSGATIDEEVTWSCSSGQIDSTGLFTPAEAGQVNITATSGSVSSVVVINVTAGWPVSIVNDMPYSEYSIDNPISLVAHLADRAGNPVEGDVA